MRTRIILPTLLIAAVIIAALPTQAVGTWSAWLYDAQTGVVWRVDAAGSQSARIQLPAPPASDFSERLLISNDARFIGYTLDARQFLLYDTVRGRLAFTYTLPEPAFADSFSVGVSAEQFSEDAGRVAYAYQSAGGWRIVVLDTRSGVLVDSLDHGGTLPAHGVPLLFDVTETRVLFHLPDESAAWTGYAWDTLNDSVSATGMELHDEYALFRRTGDVIMPGDFSSAAISETPDALLVYHTLSGQAFPFYAEPGASLSDPRFIQNGERIIVSVESGFGSDLRVVERDGDTVGTLHAPADIRDVYGVPEGLIYTLDSQLWYADTRGTLNAGRVLADVGQPAHIVAVSGINERVGTYEGWANLSPGAPLVPQTGQSGGFSGQPLTETELNIVSNLMVIGTRAAQPVLELTPNSVVTLPPPGR